MKKNEVFCIYKHTSPSGKAYIGLTNNYKRRCEQHRGSHSRCNYFKSAIQKHGWDSFKHEILLTGLTLEEANLCEPIAIKLHNTQKPYGYNLAAGGEGNAGYKHSPETKDKIRQAHLGRKQTPEHTEKLRQANLGKKHSSERVEKRRQAHLGRKNSPETIEKMRQAKLGKKYVRNELGKFERTGGTE